MTDQLGDFRLPETRQQRQRRYLLLALVMSVGLILLPGLYSTDRLEINVLSRLGQYMCYAILAISLDLIWGYTGLLCLCQALFFCLGGYAMGMYLAHHGGPEGNIGLHLWGKIPGCLFVVDSSVSLIPVPWFWKPFWTLPMTILLGVIIPGIVAGIIGFFVFRSRVRGVFFAILTQAIALAALTVFNMNEVKLCGTNGMTNFDRVILSSQEQIDITWKEGKTGNQQLSTDVKNTLVAYCNASNQQYQARDWLRFQDKNDDDMISREESMRVTKERFEASDTSKDGQLDEDELLILCKNLATKATSENQAEQRVVMSETVTGFRVTVTRDVHPNQTLEQIDNSKLPDGNTILRSIADTELVGYKLDDNPVKLGLYYITFLTMMAVYLVCRMLVQSRLGRVLVAVRDNESRLRFAGYQPYQFKVFVFAVSAMIAGVGGLLYTPQKQIITPSDLKVTASILVVIWVAVGGRGTLVGAILGALLVNQTFYFSTSQRELLPFLEGVLPENIYSYTIWQPTYWPFIMGGLFVSVVLLFPTGLMGLAPRLKAWLRGWKKSETSAQDAADEVDPRFEAEGESGLQDRLRRIRSIQRQHDETHELNKDILSVDDLTVVFDGFKALDIKHYGIPHYQLNVIIGPNGAGKTTLCDVISGKTPPTTGKVTFADRNITNWPESQIARLGVGRKFQTPSIFDGLTVTQNMELALPNWQQLTRNVIGRISSEEADRIANLLKRVRLDDDANRLVRSLSHGQRQWLEISMLILSSPQLLLVDEPAAGLTDEETVLTAELLLELQEEHSIIVIEHDMDFVRLLNAPVTVLNEGMIMAQGSMEEVQANEKVMEAYLGR
ncbi:MAG: urea ABC transporter ATP-binding protein UrtD [Pirellulaceae bacterium]|nr:urea ABC transporter ATP-binding protein UrtD [Pirellulaceae bacterium]